MNLEDALTTILNNAARTPRPAPPDPPRPGSFRHALINLKGSTAEWQGPLAAPSCLDTLPDPSAPLTEMWSGNDLSLYTETNDGPLTHIKGVAAWLRDADYSEFVVVHSTTHGLIGTIMKAPLNSAHQDYGDEWSHEDEQR